MSFYFDRIYNPVYDFLVAQNAPYHQLQETCIKELELTEGDQLLCAGVGTGNEILRILKSKPGIHIMAVDSSQTALHKAQKKAAKFGRSIETKLMDVQDLKFPDGIFDKVLCIHVTDFVKNSAKASEELLRVLKKTGKFAVTFPSAKEDFNFGMSVIGGAIRQHINNKQYYKIPAVLFSLVLGTIVYLPFLFRKERREYTKQDIDGIFAPLSPERSRVEEYAIYNDYIVCGEK